MNAWYGRDFKSVSLKPLAVGMKPMRIPKYKIETVADPAQPFDAVYFIDSMRPATLIR